MSSSVQSPQLSRQGGVATHADITSEAASPACSSDAGSTEVARPPPALMAMRPMKLRRSIGAVSMMPLLASGLERWQVGGRIPVGVRAAAQPERQLHRGDGALLQALGIDDHQVTRQAFVVAGNAHQVAIAL